MIDRQTEAALIGALRDVAKAEILPCFRNLDAADIDTKTGPEDLVTVADRAAEAAMAERIARILPDAALVGEEAVSDDPSILDRLEGKGTCVILDPIDGTANFARGNANFGMILAVTEGAETVLGVLYDPVMDDWIVARKGGGAWFCREGSDDRRLEVRASRGAVEATGYLPLYLFPKVHQPALAALYPRIGRVESLRCSCHEYRMIAFGHADFLTSHVSKPWDHAAGQLVVAEAGGDAGMLDGGSYDCRRADARLVAASGSALRAEIAGMVIGALGEEVTA
ncbi:inositol monophosphatase family protein [Palleronia sp. LCG004]|uniref:inositol monophosphatase family protein n=1 Tax=Palleronia sp. LCG004 TaxID=3079304 RepID=UPI002942BAFF|nr:inositol monophosphatase family protein [Palleronia sp. LCG004]WOI56556.1 inositol monophosphatase family protein [Palleronia sp. LCG004]